GAEVESVGAAQHRDVDMIVDHKEGIPDQLAQAPRQGEQLASGHGLVAELDDVGAATDRGRGDLDEAFRRSVWSYDVELCNRKSPQPPAFVGRPPRRAGRIQLRIWRSFS